MRAHAYAYVPNKKFMYRPAKSCSDFVDKQLCPVDCRIVVRNNVRVHVCTLVVRHSDFRTDASHIYSKDITLNYFTRNDYTGTHNFYTCYTPSRGAQFAARVSFTKNLLMKSSNP